MPSLLSMRLAIALAAAPVLGHAAAPPASGAELQEELRALADDDQCAAGDKDCALNAVQLRGAKLEEGDEADLESAEVHPHHHHHDGNSHKLITVDLSSAWATKLSAMIALVMKNVTLMDWKVYDMMLDVKSTNETLFKVPNRTIGVNGTEVDWTAHPVLWFPTPPAAPAAEGAASLLESDSSRPHHHHKHGAEEKVPPRAKKVQGEMKVAQSELQRVWRAMTEFERQVNWVNNYMGFHPRHMNGRLVLEQEAAEELVEDSSEWSEDKKDVILNQIESAWDQADKIWANFGKLGKEMQKLKRRVARYLVAIPGGLKLLETEDEGAEGEEDHWSLFGTTEQCCLCKSGSVGWSASGKCSFCKGTVSKKRSVSSDCTAKAKNFKGNQVCADNCKKVLGSLLEVAGRMALLQSEAVVDAED
mmetsp:Transcript_102268/g.295873  ORF Transcript_102268/g.295873 Transcript_102268/m.295873 type:complete len:418 (-) Transcript_102268:132-1385(-)